MENFYQTKPRVIQDLIYLDGSETLCEKNSEEHEVHVFYGQMNTTFPVTSDCQINFLTAG